MGAGFELVNNTKKEKISFLHLPVNTKREITGNPVSSAIVSWYLFKNQGDEIQFVSNTYEDWPFTSGNKSDLQNYKDKTDSIIIELIENKIIQDNGIAWKDKDEPESVFIRDLSNIWNDKL
jgi:hypothetical protein